MASERNESLQSCRLTAPSALNHNRTFKLECYWNAKSNADTNTKLTVLCPKTARNQTKEFISSTKKICEGYFTLGTVLSTLVPVWKFRKERKHQHSSTLKNKGETKKSLNSTLFLSIRFIIQSHHKPVYFWLLKDLWANIGGKWLKKSEFIHTVLTMWMTQGSNFNFFIWNGSSHIVCSFCPDLQYKTRKL